MSYNSRPRENRSSSDGDGGARPHRDARAGHDRGHRARSADDRHCDRRQDTWPSSGDAGLPASTTTSLSEVTT